MSSPSIKLFRLRGIFVAYFVLKSLAGAVLAFSVLRPLAGKHFDWGGWSASSLASFSLAVTAVILVIALLIFGQLLRHKNWARVLLLVVGWLTVISAVFTLLASPRIGELGSWLSRLAPVTAGMDWEKLLQYDRIQKVLELFFWGYLIWVLQFDTQVRDGFLPPEPVA